MKKALAGILFGLLVATAALAKPGTSKNLGKKEWPVVNGVTTIGNKLYVASGLTLLVVDATGKSTDLYPNGAPDWGGNLEMLTTLDGKIYMLGNGTLFRIDPKDGKETKLSEDYRYPGGMAGLAGSLYIASDYRLWKVDPKTGGYKKFTDRDWNNVHDIVALDGKLYIVDGYELTEVTLDGKYKSIGKFSGVGAMTAANGKLYLFINEPPAPGIHVVDKTGKDTVLPLPADWDGTTGVSGLAAMNGKLYLLMPFFSTTTLFTMDTK